MSVDSLASHMWARPDGLSRLLLGCRAAVLAVLVMAEAARAGDLVAVKLRNPAPAEETNTVTAATNVPVLDFFDPATVLFQGLRSPDGIARDAETGDIFVSEEDSAAIVRIQTNGTRKVLFTRSTPVYEEHGATRKKVSGLRSPEGLALDREGRLYMVEDVPGGRLISFNIREPALTSYPCGRVEPMPINDNCYAWESVAIGPAGEVLVVGSTMEFFLGEARQGGVLGAFEGALLYRDIQGKWWMPLHAPMSSLSAVCFSPDGKTAFFAGEIPGAVGALDLRKRNLRTFYSDAAFRSPEGLCALPDGSVLVAEEGGRILRWDPMADRVQEVFANVGALESIEWDAARRRVLATDDQLGDLLSLDLRADVLLEPPAVDAEILFETQYISAEMIPEQCPAYLAGVLKIGGYDPGLIGSNLAFQVFARKYSLVAIDAEASMISAPKPDTDPIRRVQFVIVAPYLMGSLGGQFVWSSSGFVAVMKSGKKVKTRMVPREVIRGDVMESLFTPMGGKKMALPIPMSSRVDKDGVVSIHFMGMGVTSDYLVLLNTAAPETSFLLVMEPDEKPLLYSLQLPPKHDRSHWVIALQHEVPEAWRELSDEE